MRHKRPSTQQRHAADCVNSLACEHGGRVRHDGRGNASWADHDWWLSASVALRRVCERIPGRQAQRYYLALYQLSTLQGLVQGLLQIPVLGCKGWGHLAENSRLRKWSKTGRCYKQALCRRRTLQHTEGFSRSVLLHSKGAFRAIVLPTGGPARAQSAWRHQQANLQVLHVHRKQPKNVQQN